MTPPNTRTSPSTPRLAYLVSRYPSFSHDFVDREVRNLRQQGFEIRLASLHPPERAVETRTSTEREEAAATFYVSHEGLRGAASAAGWALRQYPGGFIQSLLLVWKLSRFDLSRLLVNHLCWIQALVLGRWMEQHGVAHLHIHFATRAAMVGLMARQAFPIEYSLTVHGPDEFYDARGHALREKVMHAKFVLCISDFARSQLMNLAPSCHWDKLHVWRRGVDTGLFQPVPRPAENECFTIISVGRLVDAKGHLVLLRAVKRLHDAGRPLRLFLIGEGPLEAELKNWVCSHGLQNVVTLTGRIEPGQVREYYACADCFALASFAEGMPLVLMEAMAMGVPCVATQIAGIPELLHDEREGLLVAAGDEVGLAAAIGVLVDDPDLRGKLGRAGRARIAADYPFEKSMRLLADKLRNLLTLPA